MLLNEFKINKVDECIYIKNTKKIMSLYVPI
jgi:hypothetical protein